MRKIVTLVILFMCVVLSASAEDSIVIMQKAEAYLQAPIPIVTDKKKCFSGNKHNYESLSTYMWEDPNDSKAPWIYRDGERNPERLKYDGDKINQFSYHCKYFSHAYALGHEDKYKERYNREIRDWFVRPSTRMYPNMEYAQIRVNTDHNHGQHYGIIDGYVLIDVIESLERMQNEGAISAYRNRQIQHWFRRFTRWLQTSENGRLQAEAPNNLSIAYDVMLCRIMLYTKDYDEAKKIGLDFPQRRLHTQIAADGSQPKEEMRAQSLHYSLYNLQHIYDMCVLQKELGVSLYTENKEIIDSVIQYLEQTMRDPKRIKAAERKDVSYHTKHLNRLKTGFQDL